MPIATKVRDAIPLPDAFMSVKTELNPLAPKKWSKPAALLVWLLSLGAFVYMFLFYSHPDQGTLTVVTQSGYEKEGFTCKPLQGDPKYGSYDTFEECKKKVQAISDKTVKRYPLGTLPAHGDLYLRLKHTNRDSWSTRATDFDPTVGVWDFDGNIKPFPSSDSGDKHTVAIGQWRYYPFKDSDAPYKTSIVTATCNADSKYGNWPNGPNGPNGQWDSKGFENPCVDTAETAAKNNGIATAGLSVKSEPNGPYGWVTKSLAKDLFKFMLEKDGDICEGFKKNSPFSCTGVTPKSPFEVLSLTFANTQLVFTALTTFFSAIFYAFFSKKVKVVGALKAVAGVVDEA